MNRLLLLLALLPFSQPLSASGWEILATDNRVYAAPTLANGIIGITPAAKPLHNRLVILNGVMDIWGEDKVQSLSPAPNFMNLDITYNGVSLNDNGDISNWQQTLDLKGATLTTEFLFKDCLKVQHSLYVLRQLPHSVYATLKVEARCDGEVKVSNRIKSPDTLRAASNSWRPFKWPHTSINLLTHSSKTAGRRHQYTAATSFVTNPDLSLQPNLEYLEQQGDQVAAYNVKAGQMIELGLVGSLTSSAHFQDPNSEAERLTIFAVLQGGDKLISDHKAAWGNLWQGDIEIKGDEDAQRAIRFGLYNLYSNIRAGGAYGLAPMGLSSLEYYGHTFWDSELWMLPPLMLLQPDLAKSALEYRFKYLDAAKNNAMVHGYRGAMFPWEADDKGQESTPAWALSGAFEHHISAVVGLAFWNYYLVTQDEEWLTKRAYPVLKAVANFWVSRVTENSDGGFDILNVVGADEYAQNVDNNAFTNGAAISVLKAATKAAKKLGKPINHDWENVAGGLTIEKMKNGVTSEYTGYDGRMVKQADVNLLAYPLEVVSGKDQLKRDLDYYAPRFDEVHGPAMTNAILSILASRLGERERGWDFFQKAYKPKERPPFGALAEATSLNNPYFSTGAGGMLQAVLNGFAGLHISDKGVVQKTPLLPAGWDELIIKGAGPERRTYRVTKEN